MIRPLLLLAVLLGVAAAPARAADPVAPEAPAVEPTESAATAERNSRLRASAAAWRELGRWDLAEEALALLHAATASRDVEVDLAEVALEQARPLAARSWLAGLAGVNEPDVVARIKALTDRLPPLPPRTSAAPFQLRKEGRFDEAEWAARHARSTPAQLDLELGYGALGQKRIGRARAAFAAAAAQDDPVAAQATRELAVLPTQLAPEIFIEAAAARADGDFARSERLLLALFPLESEQRVALELAYSAIAEDKPAKARQWLDLAMAGPDPALADAARTQRESMPDLRIQRALEAGWKLKGAGQGQLAIEAFQAAGEAGADTQIVALEIADVLLGLGREDAARPHLEAAAAGADEARAQRANDLLADLPTRRARREMAEAQAARAAKDFDRAAARLSDAEADGGEPCALALERGYLFKEQGRLSAARTEFSRARRCDDAGIADAAAAELKSGPRLLWADLYAELYGWHRFRPIASTNTNLVPMARLRGYLHPIPKLDLDPYVFLQISRDVASRGSGPNGIPLVYADNTAMLGVGVLFRFWQRRVGLFAQIGPAFNLLADGGERVALDARAGAFFGLTAPGCNPAPQVDAPGVRLGFDGCAELYAEAVWVSRFDNNLFTVGRGRLAFTFLVTGPVAWQPIVEARIFKDINNDYWNNLVDAGAGFRWRLLAPIGLDLMLGVHGGTYFGLANHDPAPTPLGYAELRLQAATYVAF